MASTALLQGISYPNLHCCFFYQQFFRHRNDVVEVDVTRRIVIIGFTFKKFITFVLFPGLRLFLNGLSHD